MGLITPSLGFSMDLKGHWILEKSEMTYTVTHPLHIVHGKSLTARGKGVCYKGFCEFHVGVLVKSFESGDGNRDFHMLQVVKAGLYPLIDVKAGLTETELKKLPGPIEADFLVQFAGQTVKIPRVKLEASEMKPDGARLTGILQLKLKDFQIQAPSLLTIPVQDLVPVKLDMFWKRVDSKETKK